MTPEQALAVIDQERLDVMAEGMTAADCEQIAAYVLASEYRKLKPSETTSMIYSAAERIEGGKVKLHLAPPPIWDGCVTFDSECVINGYHVPAGTTWNVILRSEVK